MEMKSKKLITIWMTPEQLIAVDDAWKRTDGCMNRSQFIKRAINTLADEAIC